MDFSIPAKNMVYHPLSRLVPLFIQQRYDTNPAVRSTSSQKIYLLCLSGVEGLLSGAQKPLNDPVTNLQLKADDPSGASPLRDRHPRSDVGVRTEWRSVHVRSPIKAFRNAAGCAEHTWCRAECRDSAQPPLIIIPYCCRVKYALWLFRGECVKKVPIC